MKSKKKKIELLKGKKNNNFEENFIAEDPFDIFYTNCDIIMPNVVVEDKIESKKEIINEDDFLKALKRPKEEKTIDLYIKPEIHDKLEFYTSDNIKLRSSEMYKFPHISDIKYEEGYLFKSIYSLFIQSLLFVYKNKQSFILKYKTDILIYADEEIKATKGLEKNCKTNDINFTERQEFIIIKGIDICLLIDFLVNEPLSNSYVIPILLSKTRFINGIYYEIDIIKGKSPIKDQDQILHKYIIEGPFLNLDYIEFYKYKHKIVFNEYI